MNLREYRQYDALGLALLIKLKEISAIDLLQTAIAAIESVNPALNAITQKLYDHAFAAINAGLPKGPFTGVPFLLKDAGISLAGTSTYHGSRWFDDRLAERDSTLTLRHKRAGLVILGKTNAPELGLSVTTEPTRFGATKNPWDIRKTTGGSSGGAAAAVASGITPIAHATDGGGSIRIPASCCGLFGLKPSRGRVPCGPDRGESWHGLAIAHAVTRTVRDSAALLDATAGPELGDPYFCKPKARAYLKEIEHPPKRLKIGYSTQSSAPVHPDCIRAVEDAAKLCEQLGHIIEEVPPPLDCAALSDPFLVIAAASNASAIAAASQLYGKSFGKDDFEPVTWGLIERGLSWSAKDLSLAIDATQRASRIAARFHEAYDLYLCPTLAKRPQTLGQLTMTAEDVEQENNKSFWFSPFTAVANMTGQPSANLPLYTTRSGLPIGVMFTAAYGEEGLLFSLAAQLEAALPWVGRIPRISVGNGI